MATKKMKRYCTTELTAIHVRNDIVEKINNIEKVESTVCRSKFKILVVHDNHAMANRIKIMIKEETVFTNIYTCSNIEEARQLCASLDINLVLTGYRMGTGKEDCYDLFKYIKQNIPKTCFIMITGISTTSEYNNLKHAGVPVLNTTLNGEVLRDLTQAAYVKYLYNQIEVH